MREPGSGPFALSECGFQHMELSLSLPSEDFWNHNKVQGVYIQEVKDALKRELPQCVQHRFPFWPLLSVPHFRDSTRENSWLNPTSPTSTPTDIYLSSEMTSHLSLVVLHVRDIGRPANRSYSVQVPLQFQQLKVGQVLGVLCANDKCLASLNRHATRSVCQIGTPRRGWGSQKIRKRLPAVVYRGRWPEVCSAQPVELESDRSCGFGEGLECEPRLAKPETELAIQGEVVGERLSNRRILVKLAPGLSLVLTPEGLE